MIESCLRSVSLALIVAACGGHDNRNSDANTDDAASTDDAHDDAAIGTYAIGGTISGLVGTVVLRDDGGDDLTITANGSFTFATPIATGSTYAVGVSRQPTTQSCLVNGGRGTVGTAPIATIAVTCTSAPRVQVQVAAGAYHTCARLSGGIVKCWGLDGYGQLGLGDTSVRGIANDMDDALPIVNLGTGRTAKQIAAGWYHTCAVLDDDRVKCWGYNIVGELGLGDTTNRGDAPDEMGDALPAVNLGTGRTAVAIAAGYLHTCALLDDGSVKCWGYNLYGELGLGDTVRRGVTPGDMGDALPAVDLGTGRTARAISAGFYVTCAVLDDGSVKCWGQNPTGELGLGDTTSRGGQPNQMGDALPAVDLGTARTATSVAVGYEDVCATLDDGTLKCWGNNGSGELGQNDLVPRGGKANQMGDNLPAIALGTGRTVRSVVLSYANACAVLDDASVMCWGYNVVGELGLGNTTNQERPSHVDLGTGRTALRLAAGNYHTCAVLDDGRIKCWGDDDDGQLGLGTTAGHGASPNQMGNDLPEIRLGSVQVAAGTYHSCALLPGGVVTCWGFNENGQLGVGDTIARGDLPNELGAILPPIDLGTGRSATAIAAGAVHTCALLDDGSVKCWGSNQYGELGLGDTTDRGDTPDEMGDALPAVDLGTGHTAIAVVAGAYHGCAILDDGSVKCWGANDYGELGLGDTTNRGDDPGEMGDALPAVDLGTGRTAIAIAAGYDQTCALLDDHSVKCWGFNGGGELGLGDTTDRGDDPNEMGDALPAVELGTGRSAAAIVAGAFHDCALLDDGSVKCWGTNGYGELGLGDTVIRGNQPNQMGDALQAVSLGAGRTAVDVRGGQYHTCAILDDATVKCWGYNANGQLGLGDANDRGDLAGEMGDDLAAVDVGTGRSARHLAVGGYHVCASLDDDSVKCWGDNTYGELGLGDAIDRGDAPDEMGDSLPAAGIY